MKTNNNICGGLYTKKVLQTFRNPHNYGKIKNPDGIGKVGNIVCLPPGQNIHINSDLQKIEDLHAKNKVLSHDGKYNSIEKSAETNYDGEVIILKNKLGSVRLTPDHLIFAIKIPKGDKFLRTKNRKELVPVWYHAEQLKRGDIVLYPKLKEEKDIKYLEINIPKPKWDFKSFNIPDKVPISSGLLRLFGYFLSEGNIQDKPCRTFIVFTLNIKEKDIAEDIKEISKKIFNLDVTVRERPEVKTVVVYLYSAKLARFFKQTFGNGARDKKIPGFIMSLPARKQKSLVYGLWKGDGYVNLYRDGARAGFTTISYNIAQQLKTLLLRQGIVPSIYKEKEKIIGGVKHRENYRIHVGQRDSLIKICSILGIGYKPKSYASEKSWFDDSYLYIPITGVQKKKYKGLVYNLEVKNSHSFTSEAFCVHNCGDVMHLYIKVAKNKKGDEVIKDIKFETFGCVAAISTSSIITDLVKGKTIKEALKITKDNVIKSLGGLPRIKYHCSVLAVDALTEAIYDYYLKNPSKISGQAKIWADLQKRHGIIQKSKDIIEKRYEEWSA